MAKTWDQFLPKLRQHVAGCPEPTMEDAIRSAARDFCLKSQAYRKDLADINSVATQRDYPLTLPTGTQVVAPVSVYYNGQEVDPASEDALDSVDDEWRVSTQTSLQPSEYLLLTSGTISFNPIPETSIANAIKPRVALMPTPDALDIDDEVFNYHYEAIASGAAAALLIIPDKSWTNPQLAGVHETKFKREITRAFLRVTQKGRTNMPNQVRFRPFGF